MPCGLNICFQLKILAIKSQYCRKWFYIVYITEKNGGISFGNIGKVLIKREGKKNIRAVFYANICQDIPLQKYNQCKQYWPKLFCYSYGSLQITLKLDYLMENQRLIENLVDSCIESSNPILAEQPDSRFRSGRIDAFFS